MQTSARNHFNGSITNIQPGAINDEVELTLSDGTKVLAMITHASSEALELNIGRLAVGLVKASSIILVANTDDYLFSARNQLSGTVTDVKPGAVNTEVEISISDGISVVAIITNESASDMSLSSGLAVTALFKSSSVILAVSK